jgi:hypothetical protein
MRGKQLFNELMRQLMPRSVPQNAGPRSAKTPVTLSDPPTERIRAPEPNVATPLSLVSFGFVATATMVVFLGLGFFLLVVHPNEELNAGSSARDRGIEVEPRRADIVSRPETDTATSTVQAKVPIPLRPRRRSPQHDPRKRRRSCRPQTGARRGPLCPPPLPTRRRRTRTRHPMRRPTESCGG